MTNMYTVHCSLINHHMTLNIWTKDTYNSLSNTDLTEQQSLNSWDTYTNFTQVHDLGAVRWKYQVQVGIHGKQTEVGCLFSISTDPGTHQQQRNGPAAFSSDVQC